MGIRGPKSAEALVTPTVADLRGDARPEPPSDLTEEQAAEWRAVVDRLPADWFPRETHELLAQYVRHITTARRIARLIEEMDAAAEINVRDYGRLRKAKGARAQLSDHQLRPEERQARIEGSDHPAEAPVAIWSPLDEAGYQTGNPSPEPSRTSGRPRPRLPDG